MVKKNVNIIRWPLIIFLKIVRSVIFEAEFHNFNTFGQAKFQLAKYALSTKKQRKFSINIKYFLYQGRSHAIFLTLWDSVAPSKTKKAIIRTI